MGMPSAIATQVSKLPVPEGLGFRARKLLGKFRVIAVEAPGWIFTAIAIVGYLKRPVGFEPPLFPY